VLAAHNSREALWIGGEGRGAYMAGRLS